MRDPKSSQEITNMVGGELRKMYELQLKKHRRESTFKREIAQREKKQKIE